MPEKQELKFEDGNCQKIIEYKYFFYVKSVLKIHK